MPTQLRSVADRAERDDLVTVRVIPFEAGAHPGLLDTFILLEFEGGLPDILFLDTDRGAFNMIYADDSRFAQYAEYFENLLEDALSAERSIELMRTGQRKCPNVTTILPSHTRSTPPMKRTCIGGAIVLHVSRRPGRLSVPARQADRAPGRHTRSRDVNKGAMLAVSVTPRSASA